MLLVQIGCTLSVAAFRIIGLTKIPKTEFLPLDWIYRSIRIMMVHQVVDFHRGGGGGGGGGGHIHRLHFQYGCS